jgi:hypothetical protein
MWEWKDGPCKQQAICLWQAFWFLCLEPCIGCLVCVTCLWLFTGLGYMGVCAVIYMANDRRPVDYCPMT